MFQKPFIYYQSRNIKRLVFRTKQMLLFSAAQESGIIPSNKALKNAWRPTVRGSLKPFCKRLLSFCDSQPRNLAKDEGSGSEGQKPKTLKSSDSLWTLLRLRLQCRKLVMFCNILLPCQRQSYPHLIFLSLVKEFSFASLVLENSSMLCIIVTSQAQTRICLGRVHP